MAKKKNREIIFKPTFLFYWMWFKLGIAKHKLNSSGEKVTPVFVHLGGTRSSKTFPTIHLIYKVFTDMPYSNMRCIVYRSELTLAKEYTYPDFIKCFTEMNLISKDDNPRDYDYEATGGGQGGKPKIIIKGNVIDFKGYPPTGKQGGDCNIAFINEVLDSDDEDSVKNIMQRCTDFGIFDANPNKTQHFIFNNRERFNWIYSQTTYLDNTYLPLGKKGEYESKCPWDFRDSKLMVFDYIPTMPAGWIKDDKGENLFFNGFRRRVWLKDECPENYKDEPYPNNKYRAKNPNSTDNEIDRFWWLTMGEGIPASREGAIFNDVRWIDKFPETGHLTTWYSADWGYTHDNTVLARTGYNKGKQLTIDIMVCEPTRTPQITFDLFRKAFEKEGERRKKEGEKHFDTFWICCDSADSYMGENWVEELNNIAFQEGKDYNFFKISKGSISARVDLLKMFTLNLVRHPRLEIEQINYVYKKINGESTNQPDPDSKFCDCWDAIGYGIWQNGHGLQ